MNKLIYYSFEFPKLLETRYEISKDVQQRMIDTVMSQRESGNYHGGYTFHINDVYGDFKKLYQHFFNIVNNIFGPLTIAPRSKTWCWANVYNKNDFKTNMHHHKYTSSINAVYYLKVPLGLQGKEGGLTFMKDDNSLMTFLPDEGDLIIMPADVPHEPEYHPLEDYRIAINMEICTVDHYSTYYTPKTIYANTQPKI